MAIQTGGTTRLNNSGELQNISSLDATTAATIGAVGGVSSTVTTVGSTTSSVEFSTPNADKNYFLVWDSVVLSGQNGFMRFYWQAPGQTTWRGWSSRSTIYTKNGSALLTSNNVNIAYDGTHLISAGGYQVQCTALLTSARAATGNNAKLEFTIHYVSSSGSYEDIVGRGSFLTNSTSLDVNKIKVDPYGLTIYSGARFVMYEI